MWMTPRRWWGGFLLVIVLGVVAYALAEDLTLTTFYPSPRGVYKELRASGDVAIGTTGTPQARLQVVRATDATSLALLVEDAPNDPTPLVLDETGKLGLGTRDPTGPLTITGAMTDPVGGTCPAGYEWYNEDGDGTIDPQECRQTTLIIQATGRVGIGTAAPGEKLEVNGNIKLSGPSPRAVTNVDLPVNNTDVATKQYVDAATGSGLVERMCGWIACGSSAMGSCEPPGCPTGGWTDQGVDCWPTSIAGSSLNFCTGANAAIVGACKRVCTK